MTYESWFENLEKAAEERNLGRLFYRDWIDLWSIGLTPDEALDRADEDDAKAVSRK